VPNGHPNVISFSVLYKIDLSSPKNQMDDVCETKIATGQSKRKKCL